VSEGDPGNWAVVAEGISDGLRELAERVRVSVVVLREVARNIVGRRRSRRTLEALSVASGRQQRHIHAVFKGQVQADDGSDIAPGSIYLWSRLDEILPDFFSRFIGGHACR
jgi:hypothetical protein